MYSSLEGACREIERRRLDLLTDLMMRERELSKITPKLPKVFGEGGLPQRYIKLLLSLLL